MEKYREEMLSSLLKALSFDGEQRDGVNGAPFGQGNADCLKYYLELSKKFGFEVTNLDGYVGYADIGEGAPFGILGHLDTVPVGDGWTHNPKGEIVDGTIYGRGVMDDRGPVLACLYAVKSLMDEGLTPKRKIRFIFGCNEETGWQCIDHYMKCAEMPEDGFSPDADFPVINCEKGISQISYKKHYYGNIRIKGGTRPNVVPALCTASMPLTDENLLFVKKSGLEYTAADNKIIVKTYGKASHAAHPSDGVNAIVKMLKALKNLDKDLADLYNAFFSTDGIGAGLNISDEPSGALTLNLGIIESTSNSISFTLDIRCPVTVPETLIFNRIDNCLPNYVVTTSRFQQPLFIDKNDNLVTTLLDTFNKTTGENRQAITIGGGTYARAMKHGVAFGPEFPDTVSTIHMPDEKVSVKEFMTTAKIYREAIRRLCF